MKISPRASPCGRCEHTRTCTSGSVRYRRRSTGNSTARSGRFQKCAVMVCRCGLRNSGSKGTMERLPCSIEETSHAKRHLHLPYCRIHLGRAGGGHGAPLAPLHHPAYRRASAAIEPVPGKGGGPRLHLHLVFALPAVDHGIEPDRSEEHTSELQS